MNTWFLKTTVNLAVSSFFWKIWTRILEFVNLIENRNNGLTFPQEALSDKADPEDRYNILNFTSVAISVCSFLWIPFIIFPGLLGDIKLMFLLGFIFMGSSLVTILWLNIKILPSYFSYKKWEKEPFGSKAKTKANPKHQITNLDYLVCGILFLLTAVGITYWGLTHL